MNRLSLRFKSDTRIEGQFAMLEFPDCTTKDVPIAELPGNTKQGDCLKYSGGKYSFAPDETARRKAEIEKLAESLWEKMKRALLCTKSNYD